LHISALRNVAFGPELSPWLAAFESGVGSIAVTAAGDPRGRVWPTTSLRHRHTPHCERLMNSPSHHSMMVSARCRNCSPLHIFLIARTRSSGP